MKMKSIAQEIADLRIADGYRFQNGTEFKERVGQERAESLLRGLGSLGYKIVHIRERRHNDHQFHAAA